MGDCSDSCSNSICVGINIKKMEIKVEHIIIIAIIWFIAVTIGLKAGKYFKRVEIKKRTNDSFKANEEYIATSGREKKVVFNLVFNEENKEQISEELLSDITVKLDDLINGNYKIPEKVKNKNKDIFKVDEKKSEINELSNNKNNDKKKEVYTDELNEEDFQIDEQKEEKTSGYF